MALLSRASTSLPPVVKKRVLGLDRFGDGTPRPKSWFGCVVTLMFYVGILAYATAQYLHYESMPVLQRSEVVWSVAGGPYDLPITCFSESCWVSMNYVAEAHGQGAACVASIPESQRDRCLRFGPGEKVVLKTCYSQLPGQGVRLHFGGSPAWGETGTQLGLSDNADAYGWASTSEMIGASEAMPVMDFLTPLRSGVALLHYVLTDNCTLPERQPGRTRKEWSSVPMDEDAPQSDFASDPCGPSVASNSSLKHTVLHMAPQFTHVIVSERSSYALELISDIGGAFEIFDIFIVSVVILPVLWAVRKYFEGDQKDGTSSRSRSMREDSRDDHSLTPNAMNEA